MRKYELVCIIHPDWTRLLLTAAIEKVKGWIVETGGTVDKVDSLGSQTVGLHHPKAERRSIRSVQRHSAASCSSCSGPEFAFPGTSYPLHAHISGLISGCFLEGCPPGNGRSWI